MPLAAPATAVSCTTTNSSILYSAPTTYQRDLVVTNGGTATIYIGSFTAVTSVTGFAIPAGQQMVLQGPVTAGNFVWGITNGGAATAYVGLGSVVSVI
jgi:hypothetical protein